MTAKKKSDDPKIIAMTQVLKKLASAVGGIEVRGAAMPYTSVNGHMFSFIDKTGALILRLPKEEREKILSIYTSAQAEAHGVILKEYLTVPHAILKDDRKLKMLFGKSYSYVSSLKPKATGKK